MKYVLLVVFLFLAPLSPAAFGEIAPFSVHTIEEGETLTSLAARYGVSKEDIASANGLPEEEKLPAAGSVLLVPSSSEHVLATLYEAKRRGLGGWPKPRYSKEFLAPLLSSGPQQPEKTEPAILPETAANTAAAPPLEEHHHPGSTSYVIKEGDTLYRIAKNSDIPLMSLLKANGLTETSVIRIGDTLILPSSADSSPPREILNENGGAPARDAKSPFTAAWPLRGETPSAKRTTRGAGLFEPGTPGIPVYAAASGTVLHGGWMKDYGNAVYINHGNGFATFYGGLGTLYVKAGQTVTTETKIALLGERPEPGITFHLLQNGKTVDPTPFLTK